MLFAIRGEDRKKNQWKTALASAGQAPRKPEEKGILMPDVIREGRGTYLSLAGNKKE